MNPIRGTFLSAYCYVFLATTICLAQDNASQSQASQLPGLTLPAIELPDGPDSRVFEAINKRIQRDRTEDSLTAASKTQRRLEELSALNKVLKQRLSGSEYATASKLKLSILAGLSLNGEPWKQQALDYATDLAADADKSLARIGRYTQLALQTGEFKTLGNDGQDQLVLGLYRFLNKYGADPRTLALGDLIARSHTENNRSKSAADVYRRLAIACSASSDSKIAKQAVSLNASARRVGLIGRNIMISGKLIDGKPLIWRKFKGKVVLIDFWATWCKHCLTDMKHIENAYNLYNDEGFEVVGINMDTDQERFKKFVTSEEIPWPNVGSPGSGQSGWQHPMAVHYGVLTLPTAILVDRDGKVVSINARGKELDRLLNAMCNPVTVTSDTD